MGVFYVSSVDGNDTTPPSVTWWNGSQTTYATIMAACAACATAGGATNTIYVDSVHNPAALSVAQNWYAPTGLQCAIVSVNRSTGAWLAGGQEAIGGTAVTFTIGGSTGVLFVYGLTMNGSTANGGGAGTSIAVTNGANVTLVSCTLNHRSINTSANFFIGPARATTLPNHAVVRAYNCTFGLRNATSAGVFFRMVDFEAIGLSVTYYGATKPLYLFANSVGTQRVRIIDSDLSAYNTTSGVLVNVASAVLSSYEFINCKLDPTPGILNGTWQDNATYVALINTDSGDTKTVFEYRNRLGTLLESESIYAASGFQHDATPVSWQIVTTAECNEAEPFVTPWIEKWGSSIASQTLTLELVHDSATNLHNRNCWMENEYVSSSTFPLGSLVSSRNAQPFDGTSVDLTSSSVSWTGTGGFGNLNRQKIAATYTPSEKSLLRARLAVGLASKTLYLDPKDRIS